MTLNETLLQKMLRMYMWSPIRTIIARGLHWNHIWAKKSPGINLGDFCILEKHLCKDHLRVLAVSPCHKPISSIITCIDVQTILEA